MMVIKSNKVTFIVEIVTSPFIDITSTIYDIFLYIFLKRVMEKVVIRITMRTLIVDLSYTYMLRGNPVNPFNIKLSY